MDMASSTGTAAAAAATSTGMSMAMDHDMDMGGGCKISMLWNWYTIDSCFLTSSWRNRTTAMFAGTCIGVVLLVMVLEGLRRAAREYDAYLLRQHAKQNVACTNSSSRTGSEDLKDDGVLVQSSSINGTAIRPFTPNLLQQAIRAFLHMSQFAVAYIIMLLAMYYNGYVIICIFIGAFVSSYSPYLYQYANKSIDWLLPLQLAETRHGTGQRSASRGHLLLWINVANGQIVSMGQTIPNRRTNGQTDSTKWTDKKQQQPKLAGRVQNKLLADTYETRSEDPLRDERGVQRPFIAKLDTVNPIRNIYLQPYPISTKHF